MNKVFLFGRLGKDPQEMKGNTPGCSFSLATTDYYKDKASGERKEHTEWHNLQAWGATSKFVMKNMKKGMQALIEGKITHNDYNGKTYTNIVVKDITPVWPSKDAQPQQEQALPEQAAGALPDDDDIPF